MTISYTLQPVPRWVFNDLTGKPAAGGKLFVRSSLNPTQSKIVYQDPNGTNPYTNPVIFDENGMAPGPFYWKIDDANPQDLYYLFFTDNTGATTSDPGNLIWSEPVYPIAGGGGGGGGGPTLIQKIDNVLVNSSFLYNIGSTSSSPILNDTFLCPSAHSDLISPDLRYIASGSSNASDTISFVPFTTDPGVGVNPIAPDFLTDYYLRYQCLNSPVGEVYKGLQIPISKNVNNLSNQTFTLTFYARKTAGVGNQLNFFIYQYFGTGGSPSASVPIDIGAPRNLTNSFVLYSVTFTLPSTLGKNIGNSNDDGTYLQIRYPIGTTTTIDIFKPMLYVGSAFPTIIYESTEEVEPEIQSPRTGDIKISDNPFSFSANQAKQNGWIPLNDGTIGNSSSNATTRSKPDTWLLYKLLFESTDASNCPIFDSSGASIAKSGTALFNWNANNQISLPRHMGRVIASTTPTDQPSVTTLMSSAGGSLINVTSTSGFKTGGTIYFQTVAPGPLLINTPYFCRVISLTQMAIYLSAENAINNVSPISFTTTVSGNVITPYPYSLAKFQGEGYHQGTISEMPAHTHPPGPSIRRNGGSAGSGRTFYSPDSGPLGNLAIPSQGNNVPFNVSQPTVFDNMMIKL